MAPSLGLKDVLLHHLDYTFEREAWQPSLAIAVDDVTHPEALWKPDPARHSIWQIVRHVTDWKQATLEAWGSEAPWQADLRALHDAATCAPCTGEPRRRGWSVAPGDPARTCYHQAVSGWRPYLLIVAALAVATAGMVAFRESIGLATVALVYLLIVFLASAWSGRAVSILASILAFLTMNFFFTVPYHTFFVAASQDVFSLIVFLVVAEMTNRLVTRLRRSEPLARRHAKEAADAEALRQADELKSALLSAVSHDLRTPLAAIRTAATGLADGDHWTEESRRELLEMIDAEAARLSRLVGNLLDMTRIEGGVLQPRKEWHEISEVVARAVDHLKGRETAPRIVLDIPDDLPLVPLDFSQIEDVLINLLDNAIRHAPEGTAVTITARAEPSSVRVIVANEGPPIPTEATGEIFTRFYTMAGQRHGHGLGLAICKGLVEAHRGRIWVERPAEPGARFAFTLPLPVEAAPATIEAEQRAAGP